MSRRYGKLGHRQVSRAHNETHEVMAASDRAKAIARSTGSPTDWAAAKRQLQAERRAVERLAAIEKSRRQR